MGERLEKPRVINETPNQRPTLDMDVCVLFVCKNVLFIINQI